MKNIKYFLIALVSILLLSSCGGKVSNPTTVSEYSQRIVDSIKDANSISIVETISDDDKEAYRLEKVITITSKEESGYSGTVVDTVTSYDISFELTTSTTSSSFSAANPETLFNYKLTDDCFASTPTMNETTLSGIVLQDKAVQFFNVNSLDCSGNVEVVFTFGDNYRIEGFSITYNTSRTHEVKITGTYSY